MNFHISDDRSTLTIQVDKSEQVDLLIDKGRREDFDSDDYMFDLFEELVANSELQWINPEDTGDLTSAPVLGILEEDPPKSVCSGPYGAVLVGCLHGQKQYAAIIERWGFMCYEITSPQNVLAILGQCKFTNR